MENTLDDLVGVTPKVQVGKMENRATVHARRIILLLGRKSRSAAASVAEIRGALAEAGLTVVNDPEAPRAELDPGAVIRAHQAEADAVVVGGGDGSVNQILPALVETGLPFCLIPLGTANNLARTMRLPNRPAEALAPLRGGYRRPIDLGVANGHYFVNVAGLGLSARVNSGTPATWKKRFGPLAFVLSALRLARSMVPFRIHLECDGQHYRCRALQLSIVNGRYFGNGLSVSGDATLHDQQLSAVSLCVRRWWEALVLIPAFLTGGVRNSPKVLLLKGKSLRVTTRRPMRVDLDGDVQTRTPLEVHVAPAAACMLCPEPLPGSEPLSPLPARSAS